ncbi:MAG: precorrin-6y C5,15-methyltransferase (decarboxylating) subunit CbiE [Bacillota bacterium]
MAGKVKVVGTGPGDFAYATPAALAAIKDAEVLIGGQRLLNAFARPDQEQISIGRDLKNIIGIIEEYRHNRKVAVLVSGDTGIFSFADYLVKHLGKDIFEFVPGISSLQVMFARLKEPWTEAQILSLHGRCEKNLDAMVELIKNSRLTALFSGVPWTPQRIAQYLLIKGTANLKTVVGKDLTYPEEKLVFCDFKTLAVDQQDYSNSVMVIINE